MFYFSIWLELTVWGEDVKFSRLYCCIQSSDCNQARRDEEISDDGVPEAITIFCDAVVSVRQCF